MKQKVLVGMSGGVDSSVAALLLQKEGYEVIGVTFRLWDKPSGDAEDARRVCTKLDIPHHIIDLRDAFREQVVEPFIREYAAGRTPNPCVRCNRYVKLEASLRCAGEMGASYVATGHYAMVGYNTATGRWELKKGADPKKDQSYFLYALTQEQLSRLLLPLGGYTKEQIRTIAEENGLVVARKADSQDVCFIPDGDYASFLSEHTQAVPGWFINEHGDRLGEHKGITRYTVGQRKGLELSLGQPVFVSRISAPDNTVTLVTEEEKLFRREVPVEEVNLVAVDILDRPIRVGAKLRSAPKTAPGLLTPLAGDKALITFDLPQRAPAPGQAAVFYEGDRVVGGGIISRE